LGRRLDAFRTRQARGAWLTGTIETVAEASSNTPSAGSERTPARPAVPMRASFESPSGPTMQ
jgi:hypothetical protein